MVSCFCFNFFGFPVCALHLVKGQLFLMHTVAGMGYRLICRITNQVFHIFGV